MGKKLVVSKAELIGWGIFVMGMVSLFMGCATVIPVYETAQIEKGFNTGVGIAYLYGNYNGDSENYKYNFVRSDFLGRYGFTDNFGVGIGLYEVIGKGVFVDTTDKLFPIEDTVASYPGGSLMGSIRFFSDSTKFVPSMGLRLEWNRFFPIPYVLPFISLGIKSRDKEIFTTGLFLFLEGDDTLTPYEVFLIYHPTIRKTRMDISLGISLVSHKTHNLKSCDFSLGLGIKIK